MVKYRASLSLNAEGVTASAAKAQLIKRIKCDSGINNNIIVTETYEPAPVEREELVLQLMSRFGVRQELASQIINDGELKSMPNTVKSPIQVLFIPDSNIYEYSTFDEFFNGVVENEIQDDSDTYIIYCDGDVRDWDWVRSKMGDRIKELFPKLSHKFVCAVSQKLINGDASIEEFFDLRYCYAFLGDGDVLYVDGHYTEDVESDIGSNHDEYKDLVAVFVPRKGVLKYTPMAFTEVETIDLPVKKSKSK